MSEYPKVIGVCAREGCGQELIARSAYAGNRLRWCSDRCRKLVRYSEVCVGCGKTNYLGRPPENGVYRCNECREVENAAIRAEVIALWEQGLTSTEIAPRVGKTATAVRGLVTSRRLLHGEPISLHRRRNRELWPEIERRWKNGESVAQIASALGATEDDIGAMMGVMREKGVELPKRHNGPRGRPDREQVIEAVRSGVSREEVVKRFGFADKHHLASVLSTWRRRYGENIPLARRGSKPKVAP